MKRVSPKQLRLAKKGKSILTPGVYWIDDTTTTSTTIIAGHGLTTTGNVLTVSYTDYAKPGRSVKKMHVARRKTAQNKSIKITPLIYGAGHSIDTITEYATIRKTAYDQWKLYASEDIK